MGVTSYLPNRYERKYIVSEEKARAIRAFMQHRVVPDAHLKRHPELGYPVYSLYLDSPKLSLYEAAAQGMLNRFKLRVRYYDDSPSSPVFFEIKRRLNQVVRKQRAVVRRSSVQRLLGGAAPLPEDLYVNGSASGNGNGLGNGAAGVGGFRDLEDFCRLRAALRATGTLIVGYNREAYLDPAQGSTRITFDRGLRAKPYAHGGSEGNGGVGLVLDLPLVRQEDPGVILELKYVDRFPAWMQELIRVFHLERQSVPKYGWSMEAIGEPLVVETTIGRRWSFVRNGSARPGAALPDLAALDRSALPRLGKEI